MVLWCTDLLFIAVIHEVWWRDIATGELTLGDGDTRGRSFQKVAYEDDL